MSYLAEAQNVHNVILAMRYWCTLGDVQMHGEASTTPTMDRVKARNPPSSRTVARSISTVSSHSSPTTVCGVSGEAPIVWSGGWILSSNAWSLFQMKRFFSACNETTLRPAASPCLPPICNAALAAANLRSKLARHSGSNKEAFTLKSARTFRQASDLDSAVEVGEVD